MTLGLHCSAGVLPDIFYQSINTQSKFCSDSKFQTEEYWRSLTDDKISSLISHRSEVIQNSYVNLSYLELFQLPSEYTPVRFMGYVYANASHHLGRLVRYGQWPETHPDRLSDQSLVKGKLLQIIAASASHELSKRLMLHSLNLYKELAWSLASASLCGNSYTLKMVDDADLIDAFSSETTPEFLQAFVSFEQRYLQQHMYQDFTIGHAARGKILDEMRFISFDGKEQVSFKTWCESIKCKTSSFDLHNRIQFDIQSIFEEFELTKSNYRVMRERINRTRILPIARFFQESRRP